MPEIIVQALDLLAFKAAHSASMQQLAHDVATLSEEDFHSKYLRGKFDVASRIGQLQALVQIRPITDQTSNQMTELTSWFASLQPFKETNEREEPGSTIH